MGLRLQLCAAAFAGLAGCTQSGVGLGFGGLLLRTTLLLALVIALAVFSLRLAARHGIGTSRPRAGKLELLDELVLGPRQSVVAVRAGSRVLIASRTVNGMQPLGTLTRAEWEGRGFSEVLVAAVPETEEPQDVVEVEA